MSQIEAICWALFFVIDGILLCLVFNIGRVTKVMEITEDNYGRSGYCGHCSEIVIDSYKYCPACGKKLRWE